MENIKMSKSDLIAILTAIRETAKNNKEDKTAKFVETMMEEVRKK